MMYSFVKLISKIKNELLLLRKLHQKWVSMALFKRIEMQFSYYLFINCFGLFINFCFHANSFKMNN